MPGLLQPLPCNRDNKINLDGSYGLACLTGMVLINLDTLYSMFRFMLLYFTRSLCYVIGTWRTTQENSTTTRTNRQWSWLNN
jgi:hypothetical protein